MQDNFHDSFLDAAHAVSRHEHFNSRFVLGAETFGRDCNAELVAGNNFGVDDARRVVLGVDAVEQRLADDRLAQVAFRVALGNARVYCLFQIAADNMQVLPDFQKDNRHAGILAIGTILRTCNFGVLDNLVEDNLPDGRFFRLASAL